MKDEHNLVELLNYKNKMEKCILSLLNISHSKNLTEEDIIQLIINDVTELTSSKCGYLHLFNPDSNTIELKVWSENTLTQCTVVYDNHYPLNSAGIWADSVRLKKPVIHNDYKSYEHKKGLPEGHFDLIRHMSIPVIEGNKVVAVIGVGNKEVEYNNFDIQQMEIISQNLWRVIQNKRYENRLKLDYLTNVLNRHEFEIELQKILNHNNENNMAAYIDLDNFKIVNDTSGHNAGDDLLKQITLLFKAKIRKTDIIGRLGGDEFGIIFVECSDSNSIIICNEILNELKVYKFYWKNKIYQITASIGLVKIGPNKTIDEILSEADSACYNSKNSGKNKVTVYSDLSIVSSRRSKSIIASNIPGYISSNKLRLFAQPIKCLNINCENCSIKKSKSLKTCNNYEILLRLYEDNKYNNPGELLSVAENYNLSMDIDRFVVSSVINLFNDIRYSNVMMFFVNLSSKSISNSDFSSFLINEVKKMKYPYKLCFEITETAAINNYGNAIKLINALRNIGCKFALDDFGSGFSSFGYLKDLPVDFVKIDGMFVKDIYLDIFSKQIVKSINEIVHSLNIKTIAEFVEDEESLNILKQLNVDFGQGYYFKKPHPVGYICSAAEL